MLVVGNIYWRLHRERITPGKREDAQDLFWGQAATLWARWFAILGAAVLILVRADSTEHLAVGIVPVLALLGINFYLHGRYLVERPANRVLTLVASSLDPLLIVALFVAWWGDGGLANPMFLFLYPLLFAVALVFPPKTSFVYGGACLAVYAALAVAEGTHGAADLKTLVVRLITLGAMAGLGGLYWRVVRQSTRRDTDEQPATLAWQPAHARGHTLGHPC